jgi:hypothetical protein
MAPQAVSQPFADPSVLTLDHEAIGAFHETGVREAGRGYRGETSSFFKILTFVLPGLIWLDIKVELSLIPVRILIIAEWTDTFASLKSTPFCAIHIVWSV